MHYVVLSEALAGVETHMKMDFLFRVLPISRLYIRKERNQVERVCDRKTCLS